MWKLFCSGLLLGVCLLTLVGCSDSHPTAPITGTVIYQQEPVADADVSFIPVDGRPAYGRTDSDGRFRLTTFESGDGALLGDHTVTITKSVQQEQPSETNPYVEYQSVLPEEYGRAQESPLKAQVTAGGENAFTFDLTN